ncbi:MAG: lyase [Nitrosopumilaceae archaeon]
MNKSKSLLIIASIGIVLAVIGLSVYNEFVEDKESGIQEDKPEITLQTEPEAVEIVEITGTPMDNYSPEERAQHCGSSNAKSNQYIKEFKIPTLCTQPLSIIADSEGKIWFTQTNTGNVAMFDPVTEEFVEYQNDKWTLKKASMMWGITITEDDEIWFTDETNDFIWKFSIKDKTYSKMNFPSEIKNTFPQKLEYYNGYFLINDFTGNRIVVLNHDDLDNGETEYSVITTPEGFFTSQTSVDDNGNIWFVMWKYQKEAVLVKTNFETHKTENFSLPSSIFAPNGVSVGPEGNVWIADTAGSSFYRFNPEDKRVTEFITSDAPIWTFGNSSGLIKTPITRPYWNAFDSDGNMWFNQQTANRLAVFDPVSESLLEYDILSKNPEWADCGDLTDCGTAQSFGFTIQDKQVWFTEWVENNIGVLDTSVPLPVVITFDEDEVEIEQGQQKKIIVNVTPKTSQKSDVILSGNTNSETITIKTTSENVEISDKSVKIPVTVTVDENAHKGDYKILIGTQLPNITISAYMMIKVV